MSDRFAVRAPQLGDARDLARVDIDCFPDPWPAQFFVSEILADGRFNRLLVDPAGRMTAYLFCAWQYLDLHILKVATLPEFRRSGLARRLMQFAENHAVEMSGESLTLEVRCDNLSAITMYENLGYARQGVRAHYYPNGDDALIMTKMVSC